MNSPSDKQGFSLRLSSFVGKAGLLTGVFLLPVVFSRLFDMGILRDNESRQLLVFSIVVLCVSLLFIILKKKINPGTALLFFSFLLLINIELATRFFIKAFGSEETKADLIRESNWTYPETMVYTGNPFLHFTGKPEMTLRGNSALANTAPFNNFGFTGPDFTYDKPSNVVRVACVGESTTADGYPGFLESYLNKNNKNTAVRFEVLNFGHAYWTTNHSVVNFALNVVEFSPDYVVIHHGWNEAKVRNVPPEEFRGDYAHTFRPFHLPEIYDRMPIRTSVIYRLFKFRYDKTPRWTTLEACIQNERKETEPFYTRLEELRPYKRNLENMVVLAGLKNIKVILTTLPHSTDPNIPLFYGSKSIEQCNAVNREVAQQFRDKILFVDLDSVISGKHNEIFADLGHVNDAGRALKSEAIGSMLLHDLGDASQILSRHPGKESVEDAEERAIQFYIARIRADETWLKDVVKKAKEKNISVDEMIRLDAEWMVDQDNKKKIENRK